MKKLKKGPELKMPDLKVPNFLKDVFYDLHDRRLLAPLALLVVAIAAVPFLLGGGSKDSTPPAVGGAVASSGEAEAATSSFTVVEAKPGLRDYRKRLAARKPTNPFQQRYVSPRTQGAQLSDGDEASSTVGTVTTGSSSEPSTVSSSPSYTPPSSTPSPESGGGGEPHLTFFTWAIDVRISKAIHNGDSGEDSNELIVKDRVLPQTPLPGPKTPVVTYMGLSRKAAEEKNGRVLLLVSSEVKEISGARICNSGPPTDICSLIEVGPDSPVSFFYGPNEVRYTINVTNAELAVTGHG